MDAQLVPRAARPQILTADERAALQEPRLDAAVRERLAALFDPFAAIFLERTLRGSADEYRRSALYEAFRLCRQAMRDLDCPYWAFTWEHLLAWKARALDEEQTAPQARNWRHAWETRWTRVTSTLFFLGVLPYSEGIHKTYHSELAEKWLGPERARAIADQFVATALTMGYRHERQVRKHGVSVLLSVLVATGKTDPAQLSTADLERWQAQTRRSKRVAQASVTCIQRVLATMGGLTGETPRACARSGTAGFSWGATALGIVVTFERFLADLATARRPSTVVSYKVALRRFGDWLGTYDAAVGSVADVHRRHIEAYKQALLRMRCGDHTNIGSEFNTVHLGEPLSQAHRVRALSCVKAFFERIDALEYPERPGRALFVRGDIAHVDEQLPRYIPEDDWRRLVATAQELTTERLLTHGFPRPPERVQALLCLLLECGLRAGELCRLDTGCLVEARDSQSGQQMHWLRVPVGKLRNDRMIPVRPHVVAAIDTWMRVRGQQPVGHDERTGQARDFLFAWQGRGLSPHVLNAYIARLCTIAGTPRYTSHQFRHTLAVLWRARGMRIETISRLLGHKSLQMTLRYAAVMPPTLRQEFETAFAAIDEEHRATAQVRVLLSPEAHVEAQTQWRESLFVDLGIGWCGLTAYHPCETRLACPRCPNFLPTREDLPLLERQRVHLIELRGLAERTVPPARQPALARELTEAVAALDTHLTAVGAGPGAAAPGDEDTPCPAVSTEKTEGGPDAGDHADRRQPDGRTAARGARSRSG